MVLVDVYIPSVDQTYDFMLDENAEVDKIIQEIVEMIAKKLQKGVCQENDNFMLYHMPTRKVLDRGMSLASSGIRNGSKLMLV